LKKEKIVLVGSGGHASSVLDSLKGNNDYVIIGYVDKNSKGIWNGLPWLGDDATLKDIYEKGIHNAVIGIGFMGNAETRDNLYEQLKKIGYGCPSVIDITATVARNSHIGDGTYVGKRAVINAGAQVDEMCIINTGAIIEHDCRIAAFSHIAVGAVVCGGSKISDHCLIGANSTVIQGISIGDRTIVGAGSVVTRSLEADMKVAGVPVRTI